MALGGWRTRAMFDRYNIIDEADLAAAVGKVVASKSQEKAIPAAKPIS